MIIRVTVSLAVGKDKKTSFKVKSWSRRFSFGRPLDTLVWSIQGVSSKIRRVV